MKLGDFRVALRVRGAVCGAAAALLLGLAALPAAAEPPAAPADTSPEASRRAEQFFEEGRAAAKQGRWESARASLLESWRQKPHWRTAANLGRAELKVGKLRDAAEHLSYFLREAPSIDAADRKRTEEMLAEARVKVGALTLLVSPPEAQIEIDGVPVGRVAPGVPVFVEPGKHRVRGRFAGHVPMEQGFDVVGGGEAKVELRLAPVSLPHVPPPAVGAAKRPGRVVVIAGASLSAAAAAAAAGLFVAAQVKAAERDREFDKLPRNDLCRGDPDRCPSPVTNADDARAAFANGAIYGLAAAGAIGVATLTYALVGPGRKAESRVGVAVGGGPNGAGVTVSVAW